jgi:hypothetical protein
MATLYYHKTDGGAEYLCTAPVEGNHEGDLHSALIRLDGIPEILNSVYAAAPDLLDALKDALIALETASHRDPEQSGLYYCSKARAAIAKAEL